jgi:hypothetical protein
VARLPTIIFIPVGDRSEAALRFKTKELLVVMVLVNRKNECLYNNDQCPHPKLVALPIMPESEAAHPFIERQKHQYENNGLVAQQQQQQLTIEQRHPVTAIDHP